MKVYKPGPSRKHSAPKPPIIRWVLMAALGYGMFYFYQESRPSKKQGTPVSSIQNISSNNRL